MLCFQSSRQAQDVPPGKMRKKRPPDRKGKREEFDKAYDASLLGRDFTTPKDIADVLGISTRTVRNRLDEYVEDYEVINGEVRRREKTKK